MEQAAPSTGVTISVHQRLDEAGFVVRVTERAGHGREIKCPTPTLAEAEALALSIKNYVDGGCDLAPLFGE